MNKYLLSALLAPCCFAITALPMTTLPMTAIAAVCDSADSCPVPAQPGKISQNGQTATRVSGEAAPSVEYRRSDEANFDPSPPAAPLAAPVAPPPAPVSIVAHEIVVVGNSSAATGDALPRFRSGSGLLSDGEKQSLTALAQRLRGKIALRLRLTGHADEQRMTAATIKRYGDNLGLSVARAREVEAYLRTQSGMEAVPMEVLGKGDTLPLVKCDPQRAYAGNRADMLAYQACLEPNRRVDVEIWYEQLVAAAVPTPAPAPPPPAVDPIRHSKLVPCKDQAGANAGLPFRVTVDGVPLAGNDAPNTADTTRCTDIALEQADVQVRFDSLELTPVLNLSADPDGVVRGSEARFTPYSNYRAFISKAEVRVFTVGASTQQVPLAVIPLDAHADTAAGWRVPVDLDGVQYLLRVYDTNGKFDETTPKVLQLLDQARKLKDTDTPAREALIGYGENHRGLANIHVSGGAVTVNGEKLTPGSTVTVLGRTVPVDASGRFAVRQILPAGNHVVDVATLTANGERAEFSRHVNIPHDDWFYVALADLTVGKNNVTGPAQLVTGDTSKRYEEKVYVDGRLAFYLKGKIKGATLLTASADTREQPFADLFSNFNSKDPRYLLRRIDPNAYYPVYGDDSTLVEDAPTQGKFYVKLERGDSQVLWGSFETRLTGTDLVNYSRALYGAELRYVAPTATAFGEKRAAVEMFAADPGTLAAVEEFRGTGGSLYYLRNQDILVGSERLRVEVRDRDSGIVLRSTTLVAGQDYEINSIQGRVVLREPLESTAAINTLVLTGSLSGHAVWLVAGYEYTPGLTATNNLTLGGRASSWFGDHVRLGVTGYQQDSVGTEQKLLGSDLTLRYKPGTYIKLESARSDGPGNGALSSQNGGFDFGTVAQTTRAGLKADAQRVEGSIDFGELGSAHVGKLSAYWLKRDDGYSAPGQLTNEGLDQTGLQLTLQATDKLELVARADLKDGSVSGNTQAAEANATYALTPSVAASLGVRHDDRDTALAAGSSALLAETGARTDVAAKLAWHPVTETGNAGRWEIFGLLQGTVQHDATRSANNRYGLGGHYQVNDRVKLLGEVNDGDGGVGGKLGADYRMSDRSSVYLNYLVDPDRSDSGYRGRVGNLTTGMKSRYSDSLSVYGEERYQRADAGPSGLIHAFGLDLAANDRWRYGARIEKGLTSDPASGDLDRTAVSLSAGYDHLKMKYASTIEYRTETGTGFGSNAGTGRRDSWLMKNTLGYQVSPDWRALGKLNFAINNAGAGSTSDANYTEAVLGFGYRPVLSDRLDALFKYTYLADQPSPGQVAASGIANSYEQRSQVLSIDAIYDLVPKLSIGGKIGYRGGELRDTSISGGRWFSSSATLGILRLDWHVVHQWDAIAELRRLAADEARDARSGALLGVYRHFNQHVKLGAGYNFTDFSDDLTNLDYKSRGWFINLLGKL